MVKSFPGVLFLIIGNSGSGKDSIISGIINKYPLNIYRVKRYITRKPSENEDNYHISSTKFSEMVINGQFALKWTIYGLNYGIHIEIEEWLKEGHPVIVNVSRTIIKIAREQYQNVRVIFIDVPFEITVKRIKSRGRETEEFRKERIERARSHQIFQGADFVVDNSGVLEESIDQVLNYLLKVINREEKEKN